MKDLPPGSIVRLQNRGMARKPTTATIQRGLMIADRSGRQQPFYVVQKADGVIANWPAAQCILVAPVAAGGS